MIKVIHLSDFHLAAAFIKILSYYHLHSKDKASDSFYIRLLADLKQKLKQLHKSKKSQFMDKLKKEKNKIETQ